jgi:hypothetical protein
MKREAHSRIQLGFLPQQLMPASIETMTLRRRLAEVSSDFVGTASISRMAGMNTPSGFTPSAASIARLVIPALHRSLADRWSVIISGIANVSCGFKSGLSPPLTGWL